jgi:putative endopeptidase
MKANLIFLAIVLLGGCKSVPEKQETLSSGVILENMDTTVRPGDNFSRYVNGTWIKKTPIPADKSSYSVAHILNDRAQENVKSIIEESSAGNFPKGSDEQKVGDFYEAYINMKARDSIGLAPLQDETKKIAAISTYKDLASYFAYANKIENMVPFQVGVISDFKDPKKYMLYTWQGGLGLPDREYYLQQDEKSKVLREKYLRHIETMLKLAGIEGAAEKAKRIMELETSMAAKHMKKEETRNIVAMYNKYAFTDLKKLTPAFDWNSLLDELEIKNTDSIVVTQVEYMKALDGIIKNTPIETWKTYLTWSLIHGSATITTSALDEENFNFFSKTLLGTQEQRPLWRRSVNLVNDNLGEMVGKVYVKQHFKPEAKARMVTLVNNLLKAYEASIKQLDWMGEETRKQALDKLSKFNSKIGYPDKWRDYTALEVVHGDLYGNIIRSTLFEYRRNIDKLGKPVDRTEWDLTPQEVNAYYSPWLNEVVFPAAILQPPFFNMEADDAVNYGAIGAIIGHEIGHGFDDQGSTFDGNGAMRNWWTEKDKEEFKKRTQALVAQYNAFKVFDDLNVNGEFTQGENIGDLGGFSIALKAYKESLQGKPEPVIDGFTGTQRVFLGFGQCWAHKSREEALRTQVNTDPHSPAIFRANGTVRNVSEFYEAFNVQPGDSLYVAPEQRVKIW